MEDFGPRLVRSVNVVFSIPKVIEMRELILQT